MGMVCGKSGVQVQPLVLDQQTAVQPNAAATADKTFDAKSTSTASAPSSTEPATNRTQGAIRSTIPRPARMHDKLLGRPRHLTDVPHDMWVDALLEMHKAMDVHYGLWIYSWRGVKRICITDGWEAVPRFREMESRFNSLPSVIAIRNFVWPNGEFQDEPIACVASRQEAFEYDVYRIMQPSPAVLYGPLPVVPAPVPVPALSD
jgi:hypothetical protein